MEMLAGWHAGPVIGLVAVLGFFIWMIVLSITDGWTKVRLAELEAEQKREYLQRGLSVEEIERLLRASRKLGKGAGPVNEQELEANLASLLVQHEVSAEAMEPVLRAYQAADPAAKKAIHDAIAEMLDSEPEEEQLVTAVRALCRLRERGPAAPVVG